MEVVATAAIVLTATAARVVPLGTIVRTDTLVIPHIARLVTTVPAAKATKTVAAAVTTVAQVAEDRPNALQDTTATRILPMRRPVLVVHIPIMQLPTVALALGAHIQEVVHLHVTLVMRELTLEAGHLRAQLVLLAPTARPTKNPLTMFVPPATIVGKGAQVKLHVNPDTTVIQELEARQRAHLEHTALYQRLHLARVALETLIKISLQQLRASLVQRAKPPGRVIPFATFHPLVSPLVSHHRNHQPSQQVNHPDSRQISRRANQVGNPLDNHQVSRRVSQLDNLRDNRHLDHLDNHLASPHLNHQVNPRLGHLGNPPDSPAQCQQVNLLVYQLVNHLDNLPAHRVVNRRANHLHFQQVNPHLDHQDYHLVSQPPRHQVSRRVSQLGNPQDNPHLDHLDNPLACPLPCRQVNLLVYQQECQRGNLPVYRVVSQRMSQQGSLQLCPQVSLPVSQHQLHQCNLLASQQVNLVRILQHNRQVTHLVSHHPHLRVSPALILQRSRQAVHQVSPAVSQVLSLLRGHPPSQANTQLSLPL